MSVSVKFNDVELNEYIDVLQGFTPFAGAEWQPEVNAFDGSRSGDEFVYQRHGAKEIEMPFRIRKNLKEKYASLEKILNVTEPKQLIFGNIPDRYFLAVPSGDLNLEQIWQSGTGEITWIVPDGLTHSTVIKEFTAAPNADGILEATIVNNGSADAPISYEITHKGDNGYIGIVSEKGAMQYGFVEEADGVTYKQSEILKVTEDMFNAPNDASGTPCVSEPSFTVNGELGSIPWTGAPANKFLGLTKDVVVSNKWHGGQRTIQIKADSEGHIGAANFTCYWRHWFQKAYPKQRGFQSIFFLDANKKPICGIRLGAYNLGDLCCTLDFVLNEKYVKSFTGLSAHGGIPYGEFNGHDALTKEGSKVTFYCAGKYYTYSDPSIANTEIVYIQINISNHKNDPEVTRNYFGVLTFTKNNVEKWKDVPNRYGAGDILTIDGETRKVYVNGMPRQGDEVRGSVYFKAAPGITKAQFMCSNRVSEKPTIKATIREAYL